MDTDQDLDDVSAGDQVTLVCTGAGNPAPEIIWYRDVSGEIVSRQETLIIRDIRRDQAGGYLCQANNSVGQSNPRKIEIQVKCEYLSFVSAKILKQFQPTAH